MTNISKLEQDPTVDKGGNCQWPWLTCRQVFLEMLWGLYLSLQTRTFKSSGQMLEGGENHNISKNQTNPTVQYGDMAVLVSALKIHSLTVSPFFFHLAILSFFCIILLFI
jgi:hypothetical protein